MTQSMPVSPVPNENSASLISSMLRKLSKAGVMLYPPAFMGLRGRSATERALRLQNHARNASSARSVLLGLFSPTPICILLVVIDAAFPLSDPRLGPAQNIGYFARNTFADSVMAFSAGLILLLVLGVPTRLSLACPIAGLALLIGIFAEAPWIIAAFVWKFPVPGENSCIGLSLCIPLAICVFFIVRSPSVNHRWVWRRRILRPSFVVVGLRILVSGIVVLMVNAFVSTPIWIRLLILFAVRVIKFRFQQYLSFSTLRMPKSGVETSAVSGEAMFTMFHIACIQIQASLWLVALLMAVDVMEAAFQLRSMQWTLTKEKMQSVSGTRRSFGSAKTATSTSERVEFERVSHFDAASHPFTDFTSNGGEFLTHLETLPVRRIGEVGIEFSPEPSFSHKRMRHTKSAKIYCANPSGTKFVTRNGAVVRGRVLPPRNSAPSLMGNGTRRPTPVEHRGSQTQRVEPINGTTHRHRPRLWRRGSACDDSAVTHASVQAPPSHGAEAGNKKSRGIGETTRLRDRIIGCEVFVLEKFTALLVLAVFVAATAVLSQLPNARLNTFLAHLTISELVRREFLVIVYLVGQFALFVCVARAVNRVSVGVHYLISFALENHTIAMYAEITGYCVYVQQKLIVYR